MSTTVKVYRSGTPHALRLACFAVSILLFCVVAGGSFGLVWLRQGIAQSAQSIKDYERDLGEARRMQAHLQAKIAQEEQPEVLKRRTSATLMVPDGRQYVYVAPSQVLRTRPEVQFRPMDFGFEIAYNPEASAEAVRNAVRPN